MEKPINFASVNGKKTTFKNSEKNGSLLFPKDYKSFQWVSLFLGIISLILYLTYH